MALWLRSVVDCLCTGGHPGTTMAQGRPCERLGTDGHLLSIARCSVAPAGRTKNLPDSSGQSVKVYQRTRQVTVSWLTHPGCACLQALHKVDAPARQMLLSNYTYSVRFVSHRQPVGAEELGSGVRPPSSSWPSRPLAKSARVTRCRSLYWQCDWDELPWLAQRDREARCPRRVVE